MKFSRHLITGMFLATATTSATSEAVILLHALCRTDRSMAGMASALESAGYVVLNVDYSSRASTVQESAESVISKALAAPAISNAAKIHFVTHSMGGILVRQYLKTRKIENLERVVMLAPPNQGSEVVDSLGYFALFEIIHGPGGKPLLRVPRSFIFHDPRIYGSSIGIVKYFNFKAS